MLFDAGMVNRLGKVDEGNTVTDFDEEEIARKHTLSASIAYAEWNKTKINLIDTPGFANFFSDARAALRVVGRRPGGGRRGVRPRGADREGVGGGRGAGAAAHRRARRGSTASAPASTARSRPCQTSFGRAVIPIQLPIGEEKHFTGVVDLVVDEGVHLRGRRHRQDDRGRRAGGHGRRGERRARGADRDGGRGRRQPDGEVLRGRHAHARRSCSRASARASRAGRSSRSSAPRRR